MPTTAETQSGQRPQRRDVIPIVTATPAVPCDRAPASLLVERPRGNSTVQLLCIGNCVVNLQVERSAAPAHHGAVRSEQKVHAPRFFEYILKFALPVLVLLLISHLFF